MKSQTYLPLLLCLAIALTFGQPAFAGSSATDYCDVTKPEFFPLIPWDPYHGWGKPVLEHTKEDGLQSIAECNFNFAGFVLPRDLKQCRKLGLGAIMLPATDPTFTNVDYIWQWRHLTDEQIDLRVKDLVRESKGDPAVKGYFITDEPGVSDFPALGKAVAAVKKYAPGKFAYINLFPDYATLGAPDLSQLGTASYKEYLERFVNEVHPQFISYDNYTVQFSMDLKDRAKGSSYFRNLLAVRSVALEHHLPYLNIVASSQIWTNITPPSPANLALQAYTTLAAGYRGVTWYTYNQSGYHNGAIGSSKRTLVWEWLKEVNREVLTLAPIMSRLDSTGVFFTSPTPADGLPLLPGELVASATSSTPLMIGEFKSQDGKRYVMVVNLSTESTTHLTLTMNKPAQKVSLVSAVDRSLLPVGATCDFWLPAGQGQLLLIE